MTESPITRKAGGLDFRPKVGKTLSTQCFHRCSCNRVHRTRFETTHPLASTCGWLRVFWIGTGGKALGRKQLSAKSRAS